MPKKEKEKTQTQPLDEPVAERTASEPAPAVQEDQPSTQAVSALPPHPTMAVFRILRQSFREYHSGPGATFAITTPAGQAHTAPLTISGTIDVDPTLLYLPPAVQVQLTQASAIVAIRAAPVTQGSPGTYTTIFPANTLIAGPATAQASSIVPLKSATTPAFTMT